MPRSLASRLDSVAPSATLAMSAMAAKLRAEGKRVFPFSVGEPDFPTPLHIVEAAKRALDAGATRYTAVGGTPELKRAIADWCRARRGFACEPAEVVVSCGAKHALFNLAACLIEPGDEVVIPTPCWVSYPEQVRMFGGAPVLVPTSAEEGFVMSAQALSAAVSSRTKAVILCTPSNPTGAVYSEGHLQALLEVLRKTDAWIVVDEIYGDLVYGAAKHSSMASLAPDLRDRIVTVDGVSKSFAMTGWRIGWSIAPRALSAELEKVQGQCTTNPAAVSQAAAVAALTGPRTELDRMRDVFEKRRDSVVAGLRAMPGVSCIVPDGAFYVFADVRGVLGRSGPRGRIHTDGDLATYLLETAHAATVAGSAFEAPGHLRVSYACSEADIQDGLAAMAGALRALQP